MGGAIAPPNAISPFSPLLGTLCLKRHAEGINTRTLNRDRLQRREGQLGCQQIQILDVSSLHLEKSSRLPRSNR